MYSVFLTSRDGTETMPKSFHPRSKCCFPSPLAPATLLLLLLGLTGCATYEGDQPFDKAILRDTEMTQTGTNDAVVDRHLESGTRIRVLGMSGDGKVQVETTSGDKGFVPAQVVGDPPDPSLIRNQN